MITRPAQTVLIVDDHELVAATLALTLEGEGYDSRRPGTCRADDVLDTARSVTPGTALLDLDLADAGDGVELVAPLRALGWNVLILTGTVAGERIGAAAAAGAAGWVAKSADVDLLLAKVRAVAAGRPAATEAERTELVAAYQESKDRARQRHERRAEADNRLARLSRRERQVLERLAAGSQAGAIAEEFVVSLATVRAQIRSILTKLDVGSQLAAAALLHRTTDT